MLRAFIATRVEATQPLRRVLRRLRDMGRPIRPVDPDALHVTLRFLGQIDEARVPGFVEAMEAAIEGEARFTMRVAGMGAFPDSRRPSTIWADIEHCDPLHRIVACLDERIETLGVDRDRRPWRAHLTLARVKAAPPADLRDLFESHCAMPFATQPVVSVELLRSDSGLGGPRYTVLASAALSD